MRFFDYVSWPTYVAMVLGACVLGLGIFRVVHVNRKQDPARLEKTIRCFGMMALLETLLFVVGFLDWATGHKWVQNPKGAYQWDITTADGQVLVWGVVVGTVLYGVPLIVATLMMRRRKRRAGDEMSEMHRVLEDEYGPEEANRLMDTAGHRQRWSRTLHDY